MKSPGYSPRLVWLTVALAAGLWFVTFYLSWWNFWGKIACSTAILASFAVRAHALRDNTLPFDRAAFLQGIVSAVTLYLVFFIGREVSTFIFPFALGQIGAIYGKGQGVPAVVVFFLLLLVTGPCEEIFWRGFLQRNLMGRYGGTWGWLLTTLVYAGVHVWSLNFMLVGAAAVAGAFWGLQYLYFRRLDGVIISHALWSACIFVAAPMA